MYWKLRTGHVNRRLVTLFLVLVAICLLFRDRILLLSEHNYSLSQNILEHGYLADNISKQNIDGLHKPRIRRLPDFDEVPFKRKVDALQAEPVKEREKELVYYRLRSVKTDHCHFKFLIEGSNICEEYVPFLLILVPSLPHHQNKRQIIRETWGQFARNKTLPGQFRSKRARLAFLLGQCTDNKTNHVIVQEKKKHGDIVVGDFEDSYKNLTRKILLGLKWMSIYCGAADYILKADEDIYVNIPKLMAILTENPANMTGSIYGHLYGGGRVMRKGRWTVSTEEFPMSNYPPYMSGNSYVISGATAPKLLYTSQYLPYLSIEDAFITGVLPRVNKISQFHVEGFTYWKEPSPDPCTFSLENKVSGNKVTPDLMRKMWLTQNNFRSMCSNTSNPPANT